MDLCRKQVKSDCAELLSRFQITDSVRFETFSKIWREMQFSQIFYGTVNHQERRAFSRLVLDTAYGFFMPPYSFQIKVGGLYLLYSLYQCQIASPPEQIRLALKDWENVKKLEKDAVNAQHHDVVYILRKLASDKAFSFAAMPTTLAFKKKRKVERPEVHEEFMERPSRPQELINVELLEELSNIDELYRKLKASVSSEVQQADSSIDLVRKDLVPQLRSTVMDFYDWQQRRDADGVEEAGEGTSSQQECSNRAQRLAFLKSKAYGEAAEASKSRRHRQVEVDFTSNVAGPAHSSSYTRTCKLSLKARTYENIRISDDLWKEAATTSHIKCLTELDFGPEENKKSLKSFKC
ncbi:snRNA-activating protein complex subunit 1b isoform X2 [Cyclopterus lumpus]|uniref:Small nuclear RNA activating complex, polypeptide 1b n=1 Tax=Cyclopterus lumpus TaxID=8103 RepID=A0A8C2WK92_CYCLU|nr:snRNA-activating protein complex subunit 1b isoform X2 [Cyclopterus lumpus]